MRRSGSMPSLCKTGRRAWCCRCRRLTGPPLAGADLPTTRALPGAPKMTDVMNANGQHLGEVRSYSDLHEILRRRVDQLGISRITLDLAARSAFSPLGISDAQRSGGHVSREGTDVDSGALVSPPTRIVVAVSPDAKGVEAAKAAEPLARRSPLALEAGGKAFRGLAGRSLGHRAGYAERSAEQLLLRAQRGQPLFVRARNIGTQ